MFYLFPLLQLLLATAQAKPLHQRYALHSRTEAIQWVDCGLNGTTPILCGSVAVPRDYTDETCNATIDLELLRIPAMNSPSRGSILFNFGGPSEDGTVEFTYFGSRLQSITGGFHDLVTFAPRGTSTALNYTCFNDATARLGLDALVNINGNSSDTALGQIWAGSNLWADICYTAQTETGSLIGTAFAARDMMSVVDALDEDGQLRYWGISYGTVLGATVAAMFPDRIDKIILDGVVNSRQYYYDYDLDYFLDTDATFSGFCSQCVAIPNNCALARNRTASELEETLYSFLDNLKYNPIPVPLAESGFLIDYSTVRSVILGDLYAPSTWPGLATIFDGLLTGNTTAVINYILDSSSSSESASPNPDSFQGIMCGDKFARASSLDDVLPTLDAAHQLSRISGDVADYISTECAQWKSAAKERYGGDFTVQTKKPILLIGNTYDPVTPLASAHNVSSSFSGSVVLQQNGYGHSTFAQGSLCTSKAIQAYFLNGTLPHNGTICDVATLPFSDAGDGWAVVVEQLGK